MSRGYIYEIATNPEELGCMDESDFYEMAGNAADFFADVDKEDAAEDAKNFVKMFGKHSAETEEGSENGGPWFVLTDDVRRSFFQKRLEELQALVKNMTIDKFALEYPHELQHTVHNRYGDAVYLNSVFYDLDYFIRECAQSGVRYYVGNVVLMH